MKVGFWLPQPTPFDQGMLQGRVCATLFGESAWVATAEYVILHKLCCYRITPSERQLGDAAGVVAVQGTALDEVYLTKWAIDLRLLEALNRLLSGETRPKDT